ncbi:hypothetical protein PZH32_02575 [Adlercreutzia equolifaciens]|uniref:hypothetical protein n=1 Tax=Adlercreutzia equolifaciens TaxID=446660 RepID=UPI0023AEF4A2|nr:hypothetical protein [Adlercreutzia equolifaciens]MDE8701843.1 hypothetical protein [Adlercreutzia equolifaciens]
MSGGARPRVWHAQWDELTETLALAPRQPGEHLAIVVPTNDEARLMRRIVAEHSTDALEGAPEVLTPWEMLRQLVARAGVGQPAGASRSRVLLEVERRLLLRDVRMRGVTEADARLLATELAAPEKARRCAGTSEELASAYGALLRSARARHGLLPADIPGAAGGSSGYYPLVIMVEPHRFDATARRLLEQLFPTSDGRLSRGADEERTAQANCSVVRWTTPDQEAEGLACWLQWLLRNEGDLRPADIFVAVPDVQRARVMERALFRRRLDADVRFSAGPLRGDPRRGADADRLHALSRLLLLVNPRDVAAWRSWCAWHRSDCGAASWVALEDGACEAGLDLADVLSGGDTGLNMPGALTPLLSSVAEERAFLDAIRRRKGFALIDAVSQSLDRGAVASMLSDASGVEDAKALAAIAVSWAEDRPFHPAAAKMRLGPLSAALSLHPRVLVVAGCNAGREQEEASLSPVDAASFPRVLLSLAARMDAAEAEAAGMKVRRLRAGREGSEALLSPARWLDAIREGAAPMVAGEEFLAGVGLRLPMARGSADKGSSR